MMKVTGVAKITYGIIMDRAIILAHAYVSQRASGRAEKYFTELFTKCPSSAIIKWLRMSRLSERGSL